MKQMENEMNVNVPLEVIKASEIEPKEVKWLWYPYIPYGKVTLLQGDPGDGKSKLMLSIAALLSKGEPLPFTETEENEPMLTNEIVLKVFSDYLNRDTDFEVVLTSRGYTVMGFDNHRQDWNTVDFCPTPEALRDSLLNAYESFRELEITGGDRDLTEKEEEKLAKERDALTALCEKEAAKCSS